MNYKDESKGRIERTNQKSDDFLIVEMDGLIIWTN